MSKSSKGKLNADSHKMESDNSKNSSEFRFDGIPTHFPIPLIKVLIVEDNVINRSIVCQFVSNMGLKYKEAINGQDAVQKWKDAAEGRDGTGPFHLVFMDIQMPLVDGLEATREDS